MADQNSEVCFSNSMRLSVVTLGRLQRQQAFAREHAALFADLTRREREILRDWALGKSIEAIAESDILSTHTIRTHRQNVRRKLGIRKTVEAVWWAQCFDLV